VNTENKIVQILKELSAFEKIDINSLLSSDIGLDSLGLVSLLVAVEDSFQIQLEESDMYPFALQTVGDITNLVNKYLGDHDA
jgi:acyl carrier protein